MEFTQKTFSTVTANINKLLNDYRLELNKAYSESEVALSVNCNIKITPSKEEGVDIITGISFSKGKISDSIILPAFDERQMRLRGIDELGAE